jgi:hypothetical protein
MDEIKTSLYAIKVSTLKCQFQVTDAGNHTLSVLSLLNSETLRI